MILTASVVVRSYNRLDAALDAVDRLLRQDYPSFEIVLVEQTEVRTPAQEGRLGSLERDPRLRILRTRPLGGSGARNEGARRARGDVIVLLDDDDLPAGDGWLAAHMRNFEDPLCLAVTGRQIHPGGREPPYWNMARARRLVLTYTPLMWQRCFVRGDTRSTRAQNILGTNASVRRSALERFGFWDTCTRVEDEASFCFRLLAGKKPEEYLVFDPEAPIVRRLDVVGGLDKRRMRTGEYGRALFEFFHNIIAHYYPVRFVLLYPCYVVLLAAVSIEWVLMESRGHATVSRKVGGVAGVLLLLPFRWTWWLASWTAARLVAGAPAR
ncbi:MAG: glycosyltransferase family 2 protein [Acidobacteria bacterium]|nr:glycosyltransferase family 2 protein [Acidobacteriota bacterium]